MKKAYWILIITILFTSCTSSSDSGEAANSALPVSSSYFHFTPQHGADNYPVSLVKNEDTYHLFYTTGSDQWGHATSKDLIKWNIISSTEMPDEVLGDLIIDQYDNSGLGQGTTWMSFFYDGAIKMRYANYGGGWESKSISIPEGVKGIPKLTWYEPTESWIMLVTNEKLVTILSSNNLIDWKKESELPNASQATWCQLISLENTWVMFSNTPATNYQAGDFDGTTFTSKAEPIELDLGGSLRSIIAPIGERVLSIGQIGNESFSTIRELQLRTDLNSNPSLYAFPVSEFKSKITSKRRGKLSTLRGDQSTWFSFPIDSINNKLEILISNSIPELTIIKWDKSSGELLLDKTSGNKSEKGMVTATKFNAASDQLQIDLLVDYGVLELFINEGELQFTVPVNPTQIYNKVDIKVDGKFYDAKSIVYGFITVD